ncbi:hypothetical protein AB0M36_10195 [Actinoplanes sp. NPDC051346]|uniref:hypothetical protein n=1 Tax=Actinoplanes sp. NPDC051346 TaxID=3155048 RepID=UPI00341DB55B
MKVKLNKRQLAIGVAVVAVVLVGLVISRSAQEAGPGRLDDAADRACTTFAEGFDDAATRTARLSLADEVNKWSTGSENERIADRAVAMGRSANESDAEWKSGATALTQACRDAGWDASPR